MTTLAQITSLGGPLQGTLKNSLVENTLELQMDRIQRDAFAQQKLVNTAIKLVDDAWTPELELDLSNKNTGLNLKAEMAEAISSLIEQEEIERLKPSRPDVDVIKEVVDAPVRKLTARWTIEPMQDLSSEHDPDLEIELARMDAHFKEKMDAEVAELDRGILDDLIGMRPSLGDFRKVIIPMIRRIMPGVIANEIIGVQPMTGPVGEIFSLRYSYAEPTVTVLDIVFESVLLDLDDATEAQLEAGDQLVLDHVHSQIKVTPKLMNVTDSIKSGNWNFISPSPFTNFTGVNLETNDDRRI